MKKLILSILFFPLLSFANGVDFSIDSMPLSKAITLFYGQVLYQPFMISPDVITDPSLVTFHVTPNLDAKKFFVSYLNNMGYGVKVKDKADYIYKLKTVQPVVPKFTFVYTPKYRSVSYLQGVLSGVVSGSFGHSSGGTSYAGGASSNSTSLSSSFNSASDELVFFGSSEDIRRIKQVLPDIDTQSSEVYVGGYVYEVQTTKQEGSGLQLAAQLLSQKLSLQIGGSSSTGSDNFIKFTSGNLSALVNLFNQDSRFTEVSSPSLRVISGDSASFSVGEDVPVIGNVTYSGDRPVQSVTYRSSGVIFNVLPVVHQDNIDLSMSQELSNFARTDTGVDNSPTLTKRSITTSVSMQDGDVIMIGGLADNKQEGADTGLTFMPHWFHTSSKDNTKTDIVIILQAKKVSR